MRLDLYLAENGLAKSRSFARVLVDGGYVTVNGTVATKPSAQIGEGDTVRVTGSPYEYVSRGGVKLAAALDEFCIDPSGLTLVDIGASSGGFTDCLLKRGAIAVYAVDSGTDQLDPVLRKDTRVVSIERFNARELTPETIGGVCDGAVCDVSFISQTLIIPAAARVIRDGGFYICLIKPQFECGRAALSKKGVVHDSRHRFEAVQKVRSAAVRSGLIPAGLMQSPVEGGDGNREFLMIAYKGGKADLDDGTVERICLDSPAPKPLKQQTRP